MPSRPITLLIVLFWVATLGWFGYRELWPRWAPGEAPPFVIELADEATPNREVLWYVYRQKTGGDPEEIGLARTGLSYSNRDDTFELYGELIDVKLSVAKGVTLRAKSMENRYRVTRGGELVGLQGKGELGAMFFGMPALAAEGSFSGTVEDGKLKRTVRIVVPVLGVVEPKVEDIDAPRGSVLNPLHPVSRIKGLRPGRRWQMTVVNPLADLAEPLVNEALGRAKISDKPANVKLPGSPKMLLAEVLKVPVKIPFDREEHDCNVIEYREPDHDVSARTFVRVTDGLVLRQEATTLSDRFYLQRMSARDRANSKSEQMKSKTP